MFFQQLSVLLLYAFCSLTICSSGGSLCFFDLCQFGLSGRCVRCGGGVRWSFTRCRLLLLVALRWRWLWRLHGLHFGHLVHDRWVHSAGNESKPSKDAASFTDCMVRQVLEHLQFNLKQPQKLKIWKFLINLLKNFKLKSNTFHKFVLRKRGKFRALYLQDAFCKLLLINLSCATRKEKFNDLGTHQVILGRYRTWNCTPHI